MLWHAQVSNFASLYKTLMEALEEYNETNAVMDLVLFEDAMRHVARISRIISSPSGHALLVRTWRTPSRAPRARLFPWHDLL